VKFAANLMAQILMATVELITVSLLLTAVSYVLEMPAVSVMPTTGKALARRMVSAAKSSRHKEHQTIQASS
jgi:hypothetical protein